MNKLELYHKKAAGMLIISDFTLISVLSLITRNTSQFVIPINVIYSRTCKSCLDTWEISFCGFYLLHFMEDTDREVLELFRNGLNGKKILQG